MFETQPTPAKRLRMESSSSTADTSIQKCPNLWFEDGNVILQAESMQFRVHRGVLCRHSFFFRDLFRIPQPPREPTVEGCPVVQLSDSSQEVEKFLVALYDRFDDAGESPSLSTVLAMIRLGHKYDFPSLRNEAVRLLNSRYPNTLEEWIARESTAIKSHIAPGNDCTVFDVVNVAREISLHSVLPAAYFSSTSNLDALFNGLKRADGTISTLPPDVQRVCVLGREKILEAQGRYTLRWAISGRVIPCIGCNNPRGSCEIVRSEAFENLWTPLPRVETAFNKFPVQPAKFCAVCQAKAKEIHEAGRKALWLLLPSFFELAADWEQLKKL